MKIYVLACWFTIPGMFLLLLLGVIVAVIVG